VHLLLLSLKSITPNMIDSVAQRQVIFDV